MCFKSYHKGNVYMYMYTHRTSSKCYIFSHSYKLILQDSSYILPSLKKQKKQSSEIVSEMLNCISSYWYSQAVSSTFAQCIRLMLIGSKSQPLQLSAIYWHDTSYHKKQTLMILSLSGTLQRCILVLKKQSAVLPGLPIHGACVKLEEFSRWFTGNSRWEKPSLVLQSHPTALRNKSRK